MNVIEKHWKILFNGNFWLLFLYGMLLGQFNTEIAANACCIH